MPTLRGRPPVASGPARWVVLVTLLGLLAIIGWPGPGPALDRAHGAVADRRADAAALGALTVRVTPSAPERSIPASWLGLSMEYHEVPEFARNTPAFLRFLRILRIAGTGPQLVRIGGDSADYTYTEPDLQPGGYPLTPSWFHTVSAVIRGAGWRVQLDLNLERATPNQASAEAQAELGGLPAGRIAGFEVGNEPDYYTNASAGRYAKDFAVYAKHLATIAPGVP